MDVSSKIYFQAHDVLCFGHNYTSATPSPASLPAFVPLTMLLVDHATSCCP